MKLVITGDSHTKALSDGFADVTSPAGIDVTCKPFCSGTAFRARFHEVTPEGVRFLDPVYRERLRILSGSECFRASPDIVYGLVMGFHMAGVYRDKGWRTQAPASVAGKLGLQAVSSQVVGAIGLNRQRNVLAFFSDLKRAGVNFFAISAPPPRKSHPALKKGIAPETLLTVNRLVCSACADQMKAEDIPVCLPPAEVIDGEGFLLRQYEQIQEGDYHHANRLYGGVMMKKIIDAGRAIRSR